MASFYQKLGTTIAHGRRLAHLVRLNALGFARSQIVQEPLHKELSVDTLASLSFGECLVDSIAKFLDLSVPRYRFHFFAAVFSFI